MGSLQRLSVFIADDHRVLCDGLVSLLEREQDIQVAGQAGDGPEALRRIEELNPQVAILDVSMPKMSGIEVASHLRKSKSQTHVIMLSMHGDLDKVSRALQAGARGYVLKECAGRDLVAAIRVVTAGHIYLAPPITDSLVTDYLNLRQGVTTSLPLDNLSSRELEVLKLHAQGRSTVEIAESLHLSRKTVETYRSRIKDKLDIRGTAGLVKFAIRNGLTTLD